MSSISSTCIWIIIRIRISIWILFGKLIIVEWIFIIHMLRLSHPHDSWTLLERTICIRSSTIWLVLVGTLIFIVSSEGTFVKHWLEGSVSYIVRYTTVIELGWVVEFLLEILVRLRLGLWIGTVESGEFGTVWICLECICYFLRYLIDESES